MFKDDLGVLEFDFRSQIFQFNGWFGEVLGRGGRMYAPFNTGFYTFSLLLFIAYLIIVHFLPSF